MVIQHNISSINAWRGTKNNYHNVSKNLEKLSSGFKVNRAADDAAGLAISEKMRGQIRGLSMAEQNAQNGISLIQTAEGGCDEIHAILQRVRELAVQSANGTYQNEDRGQIELEYKACMEEIDRIASFTHYNGIKLLAGGSVYAKDLPAGSGYEKGSNAAIAAQMQKYGFACEVDNSGNVAVNNNVYFYTFSTDASGLKANLIITGNDTEPSLTLEIGGNSYAGTWVSGNVEYDSTIWPLPPNQATSGVAAGNCYVFLDDSGRFVAYLTNIDAAGTSVKLQTGKESGKITDITVNAAGAAFMVTDDTDPLIDTDMKDARFGDGDGEVILQIGANGTADQRIRIDLEDLSSTGIGIERSSVATREKANAAIESIDNAVNTVSAQRAHFGAAQNRLEHTLNNLGVTKENLQAAESSIRDVDMAKNMMEFTKNNILVQTAQSMLAQSNQLPQGVLALLR